MKQVFTINFLPMSLNQYINLERSNKFAAAKVKKNETETIYWLAKSQLKLIDKPVRMDFVWYVKNKKKDPDGIAFKKSILDGLVMAGILKNDGWNNIKGFSDDFKLSKKEKVTVIIYG